MTECRTRYNRGMLITATRPFKSRRPRSAYARLAVPDDSVPPAFRLIERKLAILEALATHRCLSTDQIIRLDGGSPAYVRHMLRLLHRHGLIQRPPGQEAYLSSFLHEGNFSLVYALTRKGMRLLADHRVPIDPRLDWTTKRDMSPMFLAHTLEVSQFMLDCRMAMPGDASLALIDHNDLLTRFPEQTQARKFPYEISVHAQFDKLPMTLTVRPDRLFRLVAPTHHWNFALEIDRGTESLSARSKKITKKATWRKKIAGYYHAYRAGKFMETWGFEGQRILTVTTSEPRIDNMLALQREVTGDTVPTMFLYTTRERIEARGVLGPAWKSATTDNIQLVNA